MQRVRIGLTGLAFVFLAVLLAAIFTGQTRDEAPIGPNSADPLATLGLTPNTPDSNAAAPAPAAPPPAAAPPAARK